MLPFREEASALSSSIEGARMAVLTRECWKESKETNIQGSTLKPPSIVLVSCFPNLRPDLSIGCPPCLCVYLSMKFTHFAF